MLFGRVYLCRSSLFFFDFSSPFQNSLVKIGFSVGEASQNALFRSKLGLLRKGLVITFPPAKKKTGRFQGTPFLSMDFMFFVFGKTGRNHCKRSVFCVGPKNQFLSPPFRKLTVSDVPAEGCEITVSNHSFCSVSWV